MKMRKGGMGTNIIVFIILFAFGLQVWCGVPASGATCPYSFNLNSFYNIAPSNISDFLSNPANIAGVVGLAAAIVGTTIFPNPYLIFFGFSVAIMAFINNIGPVIRASGMPTDIANLLVGLLTLCFALAVWAWWKEGDVP
jgi:hypothetical protein